MRTVTVATLMVVLGSVVPAPARPLQTPLLRRELITLQGASRDSVLALGGEAPGIMSSVTVERIEYLSDGLRVMGYRAVPNVGDSLPVIIVNRGGNREFGAWSDRRAVLMLGMMASWGYVVLASQYRGVAGGEGSEEFGGADVNDVLNLVRVAAADPRADTSRIGMYGWSRGGMMTYLVLRRSTWVKAAVIGAAVADLLEHVDFRPDMEPNVFAELIPDYSRSKQEALAARSAIRWVDQLPKETPILLFHGSADSRVEPIQTLRMAIALYEAKVPFRLVFLEGGDHGLWAHVDEVDRLTRVWFDTYLRDGRKWFRAP